MKKHSNLVWALILGLLILPGLALADHNPEHSRKPFTIQGAEHEEHELEFLKDIDIHAFTSSSYIFNSNNPSSRINKNRVFDTDSNAFKFDVGELVILKEVPNKGDVGFRTDITYGFSLPEGAKAPVGSPNVTVVTPAGVTLGTFDVANDDFDLQQGYASWNAPIGNGLQLDFGKFTTHVGLEVFMGFDDFNWNFSRSNLYGFGQPFTHTGLRGAYSFSDKFSVLAMVANGWDSTTDNNDGKTFGVQLAYAPLDNLALSFNWAGGPEIQAADPKNDDDWRNIYDWIVNYTVGNSLLQSGDSLAFILDVSLAIEQGNSAVSPGDAAVWWGFEALARYEFNRWLALNLRGEFFNDQDGTRTQLNSVLAVPVSEKLWEITITPEVRISRNLVVRGEFRHDESNRLSFDSQAGALTQGTQNTVALNAMFYF